MLLEQKVKVKWSGRNINYYESKGYEYTKLFEEFDVDVNDLPDSTNKKVKVKCDFCNNIFERRYGAYLSSLKKGEGIDSCKKCINDKITKIKKRSIGDKFPELIVEWHPTKNGNKTPFDYSYGSSKLVWWLGECGHEWQTTVGTRTIDKKNCPYCNGNKCEGRIKLFLDKNNISNEQQYTFKNLLSEEGYPLKFDFAVFKENKLYCLIEYDGESHYVPVYGEEKLAIKKYRDELKNSYCKENNIKLIRIPFWKRDNIEKILLEEI